MKRIFKINFQTTKILKKKKIVYDKNKLTKIFFKPIFNSFSMYCLG